MARYYIDTDDGALRVIDEEGYEVADANVARDLALAALPAMVSDCIRADIGRKRFQVEVRRETGAVIFVASLFLEEGWIGTLSP